MSDDATFIPPLVVEFDVAVSPDHAFETWVERPRLWWPKGHTVSGDPAAIVVEPHPGGRIFERSPDGTEHDWGEVVEVDPPHRLRFLWHLMFSRDEATDVDITFDGNEHRTTVRLVQTGWDRLEDDGAARRERTVAGWGAVTTPYRDFIERTSSQPSGDPQ